MDPKTFMRGLEEQLRRVRFQVNQINGSSVNSEISSIELLNNARLWFLRTVQNTDLTYNEMTIPAAEFISDTSFEKQRNPPYNFMYPSVLWIASTMPTEQLDEIFGVTFSSRLKQHTGSAIGDLHGNYGLSQDNRW